MALTRLTDFLAIPALAPGGLAPRTVSIAGMPRGRRLAALWVWARLTLTRGAGPLVHAPQGVASWISQINGTIGRHAWSITDGRDLYVYQEIARNQILAHNAELGAAGVVSYDFAFPIPTSYILGGLGELATRPPTEEFEGGSLNFVFTNPFAVADVATLASSNCVLFAEHYDRGESEMETSDPNIKKLAQWGGFWGSRTPPTGTIFQIVDIVPTMVLIKQRAWATMQCLAKGAQLYSNIIPEQLPLVDSARFNHFRFDPLLGYELGAIVTGGGAMQCENNVPLPAGGGESEDWTKLFDARNERDAEPPLIFQSDAAFDFAAAGAIVVGRRAIAGSPEVRV